MRYSQIDESLSTWSAENNLIVMTVYKDMEIRSIQLTDRKGAMYQIWIELQEDDHVKIHAWDFGRKRFELEASSTSVREKLDDTLSVVKEWMDNR